ncbi:MAG: DUF389 domain-containing protein [Anaerolineales bacterium]|nr:DUF389 domain-containing protein [Anaerolineales bacterium]
MNIRQRIRHFIHTLPDSERDQVIEEISQTTSSSFDFFLLVILSCSIATMGLITNSPAVIIGAMLVAPLMSPIIGLGLASITGNGRLAETALSALLRGAGLAILLSVIMTVINRNLPFVVLQELPAEVLARTHPSPIDLVIALAGGLAAAYAMTRPNISAALPGVAIATALMPPLCTVGVGLALERWDVAGGAALLFITNAITIAFAAALVFFLRGFAPKRRSESKHASRALLISAILTLALLVPLSVYSIKFFNEANENRRINEVIAQQVSRLNGSELVELNVQHTTSGLEMVITVRTGTPLRYEQVIALQKAIVDDLQQPVSLKMNQVFAERLDPLIPPTFTPTVQFTPTPTLTPTVTLTPTLIPTATHTITPTPGLVQVSNGILPPFKLYQSPNGPVIGKIIRGQTLTLLYDKQDVNGLIWLNVMDSEGRVGWVPEMYLHPITATPNQ